MLAVNSCDLVHSFVKAGSPLIEVNFWSRNRQSRHALSREKIWCGSEEFKLVDACVVDGMPPRTAA